MDSLKIGLAIIAAFFCLNAQAAPSNESKLAAVQRANQERVNMLLEEIQKLKAPARAQSGFDRLFAMPSMRHDDCEPDNKTCVPNCTYRYSNGQCGSYGADYCGPKASCAVNCTYRYSNGQCGSYGPDFCGPDAACSENCTYRYSNGQCGSYGPDVCY